MFAQVNEVQGVNKLVCTVTGFRPTYGRYDKASQALTICYVGSDDGCEDVISNLPTLAAAKRKMCDEVIAAAREVAKQLY